MYVVIFGIVIAIFGVATAIFPIAIAIFGVAVVTIVVVVKLSFQFDQETVFSFFKSRVSFRHVHCRMPSLQTPRFSSTNARVASQMAIYCLLGLAPRFSISRF